MNFNLNSVTMTLGNVFNPPCLTQMKQAAAAHQNDINPIGMPEALDENALLVDIKNCITPQYITVSCSSTHKGGIVKVKTVATKQEPCSVTVGQMNLLSNEELPLNIRVVSLIRKSRELQWDRMQNEIKTYHS